MKSDPQPTPTNAQQCLNLWLEGERSEQRLLELFSEAIREAFKEGCNWGRASAIKEVVRLFDNQADYTRAHNIREIMTRNIP